MIYCLNIDGTFVQLVACVLDFETQHLDTIEKHYCTVGKMLETVVLSLHFTHWIGRFWCGSFLYAFKNIGIIQTSQFRHMFRPPNMVKSQSITLYRHFCSKQKEHYCVHRNEIQDISKISWFFHVIKPLTLVMCWLSFSQNKTTNHWYDVYEV